MEFRDNALCAFRWVRVGSDDSVENLIFITSHSVPFPIVMYGNILWYEVFVISNL